MEFERYPQRRNKGRGIFFFLIILLTTGIVLTRYALTSPRLRVKRIQVKGEDRLSEATILRCADVPLQKCIFGINLRKIARRIESRPQIKRAEVERSLPSTIIIQIEERRPFAYLLYDEFLWEVDEEGIVLGKAHNLRDLPVITGISSFSQEEAINQGIKIINASGRVGLPLSEINVEDEGAMVGYLKGGVKVYLGGGEHLEYLSYLPLIMVDIEEGKRGSPYIDLRFSGQVVVGLK